MDISAIVIWATICGTDSWVRIEFFGKSNLSWFQTSLKQPHGIPSHDTFVRVSAQLGPGQRQNFLVAWIQAIADFLPGKVAAIEVSAIYGKTAQRSYDRSGQKGLYAWSASGLLSKP